MKEKKTLYRTLLVLGTGLLALSLALVLLLEDRLPDAAGGAMIGVSSGLAAMGLSNLLMLRQTEKDPSLARQAEIEAKDERNTAIRRRAKAVSGEALQWTVLGGKNSPTGKLILRNRAQGSSQPSPQAHSLSGMQ